MRLSRFFIISYMILAFFPVVFSADFATAGEITLAWDANTEPNLIGYNIYYDTSSGHPYLGTGADQGTSPITVMIEDLEDPGNPEYTITGLNDEEDYYFAATAFSIENQESALSNEVYTADATTNSTFDGSEGCFIGVATNGVHALEGISAVILLLLSGIIGLMSFKRLFRWQSLAIKL
jgi:hypothetical protein